MEKPYTTGYTKTLHPYLTAKAATVINQIDSEKRPWQYYLHDFKNIWIFFIRKILMNTDNIYAAYITINKHAPLHGISFIKWRIYPKNVPEELSSSINIHISGNEWFRRCFVKDLNTVSKKSKENYAVWLRTLCQSLK